MFNQLSFVLLLPPIVILYYLLPNKIKWIFLLVLSCLLYISYIPVYIFVIFFLIVVDYIAGIYMFQLQRGFRRKILVILSVVANIGVLGFFKYYNFFQGNVTLVMHSFGRQYVFNPLLLAIPIGLSFHTFQSISYVVEVFKKKVKPEKNIFRYALYVMFFPQLFAGPIEKPQQLMPQLKKIHVFDYKSVTDGLKLVMWGLFKKLVIADTLALFVEGGYYHLTSVHGLGIILIPIFFSYQIYCDFSGYSDIAIGTGKLFGVNLINNFHNPYQSRSPAVFWSRWNISLFNWFKEYIYIPLGGNRKSKLVTFRNIFIVFLVSGIWHGAGWNFILWGVLNGLLVIGDHFYAGTLSKFFPKVTNTLLHNGITVVKVMVTFITISLTWIFFRSTSTDQMYYFFTQLRIFPITLSQFTSTFSHSFAQIIDYSFARGYVDNRTLLILVIAVIFLEIAQFIGNNRNMPAFYSRLPLIVRWTGYCILVWTVLIFGRFGEQQFIYFGF